MSCRRGRRFDVRPIQALEDKVRAVYERVQPRESNPMLNFDERDLLTWVEHAGFNEAHLELCADIAPCQPERWEVALHRSGNPKMPTLAEAMQEALTPAEAEQFMAYVRPRVERGEGTWRMATAYLWAVKPRTRTGAGLSALGWRGMDGIPAQVGNVQQASTVSPTARAVPGR